MTTMEDKRKEERIKEGNRVIIEPIVDSSDQSDKKSSFALTENISFRGIKVLSDTYFPIDSVLKIGLSLAQTHMINVKGRVRWTNELGDELHEIGIEIDISDISRPNRKILLEHLYRDEF